MPFHTSLANRGSDCIGSLGKSTYGESLLTPEGLPSLGDGLGSKLSEGLICTTHYAVLEKEVCYWNRCGPKLSRCHDCQPEMQGNPIQNKRSVLRMGCSARSSRIFQKADHIKFVN